MGKEFNTKWLGKEWLYFQEVDSTNTKIISLAEQGMGHGALVVAGRQTKGKGRSGRKWESKGGCGLYFSFLLKNDLPLDRAPMITLVAAMAVAKAIEEYVQIETKIKWPNDIVVSKKKICGILSEMRIDFGKMKHVVVGIGVNVKSQEFPEEIAGMATTIQDEVGRDIAEEELLECILQKFEFYFDKFLETYDLSLIQEEYNQYLVNKDAQVKVLDPIRTFEGIARGINPQGELLVEREGKLEAVGSGEVSVRGIYGYV